MTWEPEHEMSEGCICGPSVEPVKRDDGSMGWVIVHHTLSGIEHTEPDHDRAKCPVCD